MTCQSASAALALIIPFFILLMLCLHLEVEGYGCMGGMDIIKVMENIGVIYMGDMGGIELCKSMEGRGV